METNRIKRNIFDQVGTGVEALAQLFPSVVKDGEVDFEALREELGYFKEIAEEKYELTWAGKKNAKRNAIGDSIGKTLKFVPEESKFAETTSSMV